jgi:hypothetical protein
MAYKNALYQIKTEWYQTLNGQLSVSVYKDAVPITETGNFVLLRAEGSTDRELNNSAFFRSAILVVEIFTQFPTIANSKTAYDIAQEIDDLVMLSPNSYGITLTDFQITQLTVQSESELYEDDGAVKVFRVVKRYEHIINQN